MTSRNVVGADGRTGAGSGSSAARPTPAYRIIQEGLTNALRHAGPAATVVHIRYHHDSIGIDIVDDGPTVDGVPHAPAGAGLGLVGIRERVALYGGTLEAGHRPEGGFALRVVLPTR